MGGGLSSNTLFLFYKKRNGDASPLVGGGLTRLALAPFFILILKKSKNKN
jgi:hypothetical protein